MKTLSNTDKFAKKHFSLFYELLQHTGGKEKM